MDLGLSKFKSCQLKKKYIGNYIFLDFIFDHNEEDIYITLIKKLRGSDIFKISDSENFSNWDHKRVKDSANIKEDDIDRFYDFIINDQDCIDKIGEYLRFLKPESFRLTSDKIVWT